MRFEYAEFDWDEAKRRMSRDSLMKLWNELLLKTSGDVNRALDALRQVWEAYDLFDGEYTFDEFVADLEKQGLISPRDEDGRRQRGQRGRGGRGDGESDEEPAPMGDYQLTKRGERALRLDALERVFSSLKSVGYGNHRTPRTGAGGDPLPETRPFVPGDLSSDVDYTRSLANSLKRGVDDVDLQEDDLEVFEKEHFASCATVLMIDISHSMVLYGEDRITPAKQVAIALAELIRSKFPKDAIEVITFGNEAQQIDVKDIPFLEVGPFHTNTKAGLQLAQRLLAKKRHTNKQIFMITDGKPSVIFEDGMLYRNSFGLDPKIVSKTLEEASACLRKRIRISTFMIADDPILVDFVDQLTRLNKGHAFYASLDDLGGHVFADYVRNRRRRV
jgi:Ca-activated chloride channel family protein